MYILIFLLFSILFSPLGHTQTAQDILEENLDSVSYSSDREINNYEFIKSLIESLEVQDLLCPKKSTTENCIKAGLKKINKNAYKNKTIDEITYKGFKELIKTISYKDNQLELIPPKKLNKKQTTLGSFSGYLKTKNFFEEKRKQDELHLAILDKLNKKYRRKLKPLGKVRVEEYAYHEYSRFQIVALSNLMKEVIEYPVSKIGYLYLFNKDFERIKREIEAQEFLIDGYLERYYEAEEESQEREELKLKIQSLRVNFG